MNPVFSYVIVASIVLVLAWQAYSGFNRGNRSHRSLIKPIKIDEIEVNDFIQSNGIEIIAPRFEYTAKSQPFPHHNKHEIKDSRGELSLEIDALKEINIERYSIMERTTSKVVECNKLLDLIKVLSTQYKIELDQELIEAPLDGLTLSELDTRQVTLLDIYDQLYQISFQEEVQKIRRRELSLESKEEGHKQSSIKSEIDRQSVELDLLRREEVLYRDIRSSRTIEFFEELDFSDFPVEAQARLKSHSDFYYSRLTEKVRIESEFENYTNYKQVVLSSENQEEIQELKFEGVNNKQQIHLNELRDKRIKILDIQALNAQEEAKSAELYLAIESATSSAILDKIVIEGVNPEQEEELRQLFTIARADLVFNEKHLLIINCEYVLELDAIVIEDVSEAQELELNDLRVDRRAVLVEVARQYKFTEQYTKYLVEIPRIEEIDALLKIEIDNVSKNQKEELEALRLSRLDCLEEIERKKVEEEQMVQFRKLHKQIESIPSTSELDEIIIDGVNQEQEEELLTIQAELRDILAEDELIAKHVDKAEKRRKKVPEPGEFLFEQESKFRTRSKTYGAGNGILRFSLLWDNMNDLDLIVRTTKGDTIHRGKRKSSCGGKLDLEMNIQPQTKAAIENIVWDNENTPPSGNYKVFLWHRKRHSKLRKTDPTEYMLRVRVGADYFQYTGKTSYGDKLFQIASIEVPNQKTMFERIETESELYNNQRASVLAAKNAETIPDIDPNNSALHVIMLSNIIEKQLVLLEEKKKKKFIAHQKAEYNRIMKSIESAQDIESLTNLRYDDVSNDVLGNIEKALSNRKKIIESGLKKQQHDEQIQLFEEQGEEINTATTITDLSIIVFDETLSEKQIKSLEKTRDAKRKLLFMALDGSELEKEKQNRLHDVLNKSYTRGGLQPLELSEWTEKEFENRLGAAGAKTGEMNISLLWNNKNDLNLLVVTPSKEIIHPRNPSIAKGGVLDVEMNKKGESSEPIENIYWANGSAKKGTYYVYVHLFKEHALFKLTNLSECRIQILNKGNRTEYSAPMSISNKLQFITQIIVD